MSMMPEVGSKRSNGYDEYAETDHKRVRTGRMELRLLLIGRYCGAIIGKGGENVKRMREKHRVQISGLNNRSEDRVLTINGDRENCMSALSEILPLSSSEAPYAATNNHPQGKCNYEINFLVHSGHVGSVIGKGGAKIKEITEASSGKIKIYQDCLPNSNERVVAIGGETVENIISAMEIVLDTVENLPKKDLTILYDPNRQEGDSGNMDDGNSNTAMGGNQRGMGGNQMGMGGNQMGMGGNQMGMGGNQMGNRMGRPPVNQMNHQGGSNQLTLGFNNSLGGLGGLNLTGAAAGLLGQLGVGAQGGVGGMLGAGIPTINTDGILGTGRAGGQLGGGQPGGFGGASGGFTINRGQLAQLGGPLGNQLGQLSSNMPSVRTAPSGNRDHYQHQHQRNGGEGEPLDFTKMATVTNVTVSHEMCGAIIGKSGRNIREIRQSSGARVDFTGNEKGSKEDRVITITGTQHQIQIAEQLMTQFVRNRNN